VEVDQQAHSVHSSAFTSHTVNNIPDFIAYSAGCVGKIDAETVASTYKSDLYILNTCIPPWFL
jgi:hypothetical protein